MEQQKTSRLPVGAAIARLVKLEYVSRATGLRGDAAEREIQSLIDALNAFEVNLSFDCETEGDLQKAVEAAETALDVLLCDAQTQCCRIADKATSEAVRPRKFTSSRGD